MDQKGHRLGAPELHQLDGRDLTLGADEGCDTADFVMEVRELKAVLHVAQNNLGRRSAIDERTTRHPGYAASQRIRKRIEEVFGCTKSSAGLACPLKSGPP